MGRPPGGALGGDEPAATSVASWSIDHISGVTLAVREMAESVVFYQKLGFDVSYGGLGRVSSIFARRPAAAAVRGIA